MQNLSMNYNIGNVDEGIYFNGSMGACRQSALSPEADFSPNEHLRCMLCLEPPMGKAASLPLVRVELQEGFASCRRLHLLSQPFALPSTHNRCS